MKLHVSKVAAASVLVMLAAGCGSSGPDEVVATGECTPDRAGGEITHGTLLSPRGLDPVGQPGAAGSGGTEIQALFDTLVVYNTETQEYEPQVAESLDPNEDFTEWTMTLREGVTFGNGDPLTADDVKYNVERHQSEDNTDVSRGIALTIADMEVLDDQTIRFTVDSPYPDFPHVLATDVGMVVNQRLVEERGQEAFALDPTGGGVGPFELVRYSPGDEIVMEAKDDYWGGPLCIERLRFISVGSPDATVDALRNGEVDTAMLRDPIAIASARENGFESLPTLFNYGEGVVMNSAEGRPTEDVRLRQAIVAAIDPDTLSERVFNGTAKTTSAFIHEDTPGLYTGEEGPEFDPEEARRLVDEVKADGWNGTISLLADNSPTRVNTSIAVAALLEDVGINVDLNNTTSLSEVIASVASERNYDLVLWGPNYTVEGMWALMNRQLNSQSASNYYGYDEPEMDSALAELRTAETIEEQAEIAARMQQIFLDSPVIANIAAVEEDNVHSPEVGGLALNRGSVLRFENAFIAGQ